MYGTHFNLEGSIEIPKISNISIYSVHIIAKNNEKKEIPLDCTYTYKDNILTFSTIDKINDGLSLEELTESNYYLFLKVILSVPILLIASLFVLLFKLTFKLFEPTAGIKEEV